MRLLRWGADEIAGFLQRDSGRALIVLAKIVQPPHFIRRNLAPVSTASWFDRPTMRSIGRRARSLFLRLSKDEAVGEGYRL